MRKRRVRSRLGGHRTLSDWLVDDVLSGRQFLLNLIGGNLVGGAVSLWVGFLAASSLPSAWVSHVVAVDVLVAGLMLSRVAWGLDFLERLFAIERQVLLDADHAEGGRAREDGGTDVELQKTAQANAVLAQQRDKLLQQRSPAIAADFAAAIALGSAGVALLVVALALL